MCKPSLNEHTPYLQYLRMGRIADAIYLCLAKDLYKSLKKKNPKMNPEENIYSYIFWALLCNRVHKISNDLLNSEEL